jgi:MFS family permease
LIGPAIAGLAIAAVGAGTCFLIDGISYVAVIIGLLAMRLSSQTGNTVSTYGNLWQEMKTGFTYAFGFQPIRAILLLTALTSFFGLPYTTMAPIFASEILHGGPETLGFLMACSGLGALFSAVYLSSRPSARGLTKIIGTATAVFGFALILFALSRILWLSLLATLILGTSLILQRVSGNTILQVIVDEDKRGRVMSFYIMSFTGMATFGNLLTGFLASRIGAPNTLAICGFVCAVSAIFFIQQLPTLRQNIRPIYQRIGLLPQVDS